MQPNRFFRYASRRICMVMAICLALVAVRAGHAEEEKPVPTISVTGSAEIRVVPDQVKLHFGIQSRAKVLADAAQENDKKLADVLEFLRSVEIGERNIRTDSISINPIFPGRSRKGQKQSANANADPFGGDEDDEEIDELRSLKPIGYAVERNLHITSTNLNRFEQVYRGLIERGVNEVSSIQFGSTKLREHRDEARTKAIRAAKEKAQSLAGELGVKLSGVQSITENNGGEYSRMQNTSVANPFGDSDDAGTDRVAAGEIEISASVHVVFRLGMTDFE